jgi:NAD(P)-dependent dehydrogenase (short-subunit alcohol dehydrogenase family)
MAHRESSRPVALITGAAGGLGLIVTQMFLDAGYCVSAVDRNIKQLCASDDCLVIKADLSSRSAAEAVVEETVKKWGTVHTLAHQVGVFAEGGPVEDTSDETWDAMLNGNLRTGVNMLRAVIPGMRTQGRGSITVIGSSTVTQPVVTWSAFNASVSGLCTLVQTAAAELRDHGVTVNALLPTTIDTPQVRSWLGESDAHKWVSPRSLGSLLLWLASEPGRDVTGALIPVVGRQNHPCYQWHGATDLKKETISE